MNNKPFCINKKVCKTEVQHLIQKSFWSYCANLSFPHPILCYFKAVANRERSKYPEGKFEHQNLLRQKRNLLKTPQPLTILWFWFKIKSFLYAEVWLMGFCGGFFFPLMIWGLPSVTGEQGISNLLAFLVPCRWNIRVFATNVPVLFMETYHLHSCLPWTSSLWTLGHVFQTVAVFVEFFIYPKLWR